MQLWVTESSLKVNNDRRDICGNKNDAGGVWFGTNMCLNQERKQTKPGKVWLLSTFFWSNKIPFCWYKKKIYMPGDSIRNLTSSPISVGGRQKPNLLEFGLPVKNLTIPLKGARKKTHRNYQFCCCFFSSRYFIDPPTLKMENSNQRLWRLGSLSGSKTYFSAFFFPGGMG